VADLFDCLDYFFEIILIFSSISGFTLIYLAAESLHYAVERRVGVNSNRIAAFALLCNIEKAFQIC